MITWKNYKLTRNNNMNDKNKLDLVRAVRQNSQNVVLCDKCKTDFKIRKLRRKRVGKYKGQLVRKVYFTCPKCKENYYVTMETKRTKAIQAKMRRLQRVIHKDRHEEIEGLYDEFKEYKSELVRLVDMLEVMF